MELHSCNLSSEESYRLLTGCVVPRPIAWVTSLHENGSVNLAPFSTFTFVCSFPPMLGFNVGKRLDRQKDTPRNIRRIGDYVVHIADAPMLGDLHDSSIDHASGVSECELLGLKTVRSSLIQTPRLSQAPIGMECRLSSITDFSGTGAEFIVGHVVAFHVRDGLLNGVKIDSSKLGPVSRLAGPNYAHLGEIVTMHSEPK
jgi:flavin reductase (DIM6/NTAB) family NADH-FMN oxidoreductase RutF